jgi:hypothetical protein
MKQRQALKNLNVVQGQRKFISLGSILSIFMSTLLIVTLIPSTGMAKSDKKNTSPHKIQHVQYDVYAGGIHALQANLDMNLSDPHKYSLSLFAKTYGLLGKLAPWHGTFSTTGWKKGKNIAWQPEIHKSETTWRDEREVKEYRYNRDGSFKGYNITDDTHKGVDQKVDEKLTKDTVDVLSATLTMMQSVMVDKKCEGTSEVFDGKRRYKLIFNHKKEVTLSKSRWNLYEGPAVQCTAEVQPVAGKWHKKPRGWISIQEQGRERGTMPTVWMAQLNPDEPAIPVKVRVKTSYGTLFMHMTGYKNGKTTLALK